MIFARPSLTCRRASARTARNYDRALTGAQSHRSTSRGGGEVRGTGLQFRGRGPSPTTMMMMMSRCMCLAWLALAMVAVVVAEEDQQPVTKPAGICAMDGCNCTVKAHHWVFVKCVFSDHQVITLCLFSFFL